MIEEHVPHGGLSSRIKEVSHDNDIRKNLKCFTLKDKFMHFYGNHEQLLETHELSASKILDKI